MLKVVCALIKRNNKVLIARRKTGDEYVLGKWEFPGGKVDLNETDEDAIKREIEEELEITVKARSLIATTTHKYPSKVVELKLYECNYISGEIKLHDHVEYAWVSINDLLGFDLAIADVSLVKTIMNLE